MPFLCLRSFRYGRMVRAVALILMIVPGLLLFSGCASNVAKESGEAKTEAPDPVTVELAPAEKQMVETTVAATGTLTVRQGGIVHVAPQAPGKLLSVRVREGQIVAAGEVIALIDNRPQRAQVSSAAAALKTSETQVRQSDLTADALAADNENAIQLARLSLSSARIDRDATVEQAALTLQSAQTDLTKIRAGARPQEIAQAEQAVIQATTTRDRTVNEEARNKALWEKGFIAKRDWEDAVAAREVAESALKAAEAQANLVKTGARSEDVRAAEIRVELAQRSLADARKAGDAKIAQALAALRQAQQGALATQAKRSEAQAMRDTVQQRRAELLTAQETARTAELRSPVGGVVTRRLLNEGDMADVATPVAEVSDMTALDLIANVTAGDGIKIRPGMTARVTTPDAPGRTFSGRVLSLGSVDSQTNLMPVRITIADTGKALRIGAFASAEIILSRQPDAVVVPRQAILRRETGEVVFVVGADQIARERSVRVGVEKNDRTQILSGVRVGEQVIRLGHYELADGAKVQSAEEKTAEKGKEKSDEKNEEAGSAKNPTREGAGAKP